MVWFLKGELILNCNCTVFCPCVVSLGQHPPTEGYCQAWLGVRIDSGEADGVDLGGLNVAMMIDIPGKMARGNWTAAVYIDERANTDAFSALTEIFSGKRRGNTGVMSMLVGTFLGAEQTEVLYETQGNVRRLNVGKKIIGEVTPVPGHDDKEILISNTKYWMGPDITVAQANKGRVRAFGRVWDFEGRSAEICQIDWKG